MRCRPRFDADPGCLGSFLALRLGRRLAERVRLGLSGRLGLHAGASNDDSPLFRDELTFGIGTSLVWSFWESEARRP